MGVEGEFSDALGGWGLAFARVKEDGRALSFTLKLSVWWVLGLAVSGGCPQDLPLYMLFGVAGFVLDSSPPPPQPTSPAPLFQPQTNPFWS